MASRGPVIGALDVGSNTLKLTVARLDAAGGIEDLVSAAETVRLGAGLNRLGRLADDRIEAAMIVLHEFAELARRQGAIRLVGVATEATRQAANGLEFLQRVHDETGWEVKIIDGDTEADLTFRGIAFRSDLSGRVVIADVGGGSTELIETSAGSVTAARSVAIGSGTLTDTFVEADPPAATELAACADAVMAGLASIALPSGTSIRLIAVGGTAEYMAQIVGSGAIVETAEIEQALRTCQEITAEALATTLSIPLARARVLPAGIVIIYTLAARLGSTEVEIAPSGIRTGLLLETFAALDS